MDASIGQYAMQDLAGDNEEIREQLREITSWFPSIEMMRNHARGLIKVMREDEKVRAFPPGYCVPPSAVILWAMREVQRSTNPKQRARWWMYRSLRMTAPQPDPTRIASRTERVTDAVLALPVAVHEPDVQIIPAVFTAKKKKVVKQEVLDEAGDKDKKKREPKKKVLGVVRRSERLKKLQNN
ncbi:hypothetical protein ZWY2020_037359 [Hordeum vulgare]|nr:hypothetical protein ZWY2020_037359 [Hordeum vulgare]